MNTNSWLSRIIATRATSLAPIFGDGTGQVCPQHVGFAGAPMRKRNLDATTTHQGSSAWRPPLT